MKKLFTIFITVLLVQPISVQAQSDAQQALITTLLQQLATLQTELAKLLAEKGPTTTLSNEWSFDRSSIDLSFGDEVALETEYDEDDLVDVFRVANNRLYEDYEWTKNTDTDNHRIWEIFAKITGEDFVKNYVTDFLTYRSKDDPVLGFVYRKTRNEEPSWVLSINANASNFDSKTYVRDLTITLLHEFAHIVTLNQDQVNHRVRKSVGCVKTYLILDYGCTDKRSYMNAYVSEMWNPEDLTTVQTFKDPEEVEEFYEENKDKFVTWYAPTNTREDIAESFVDFVLLAKPTGTSIREQKILFFYRYPELVKLREEIRREIKDYILI